VETDRYYNGAGKKKKAPYLKKKGAGNQKMTIVGGKTGRQGGERKTCNRGGQRQQKATLKKWGREEMEFPVGEALERRTACGGGPHYRGKEITKRCTKGRFSIATAKEGSQRRPQNEIREVGK